MSINLAGSIFVKNGTGISLNGSGSIGGNVVSVDGGMNKVIINGTTISSGKKMTKFIVTLDGDTFEFPGCDGLNIEITGDKFESVKSSSGNITINGSVRSAENMTGNIEIKGSTFEKAKTSTGNITIDGSVRTVTSNTGDIHINGNVEGDVRSVTGNITASSIKKSTR